MDKSRVKRILVITLSNLGDIILTTPSVETLLKEFPKAKLDIMVGPNGGEIFRHHTKVSDVILYDKKSPFTEKVKLFIALRKKRYDLCVDLRNTVLPLILGARFNTSPFRHGRKERIHKKDLHLARLKEIGIDISKESFYIPVEDADKEFVENLLGELKGRAFVAVSPGAKSHVKRWPLKYFARLCDTIKRDLGHEIVLIGDENDRIVIERILFYMKEAPFNLLEKTNIRQLAYLIKKSKLLITNDSAPLHIGSAMDANILAFFGSTDEKKYGPVTKGLKRVLKKHLKCTPCEVAQCINRESRYECLKTISPDEAFEAVKELLKNENTVNQDR